MADPTPHDDDDASWEPEDPWALPSKDVKPPAAPIEPDAEAPEAAAVAPPSPGIQFAAPLPSGPMSEALPSSTRHLVLGAG